MRWLIATLICIIGWTTPASESERWLEYEFVTIYDEIMVTVTWYTSSIYECDDTPFITADGTKVHRGVLAVSVDLLKLLPYGTEVDIEGLGTFTVHDRMNGRWKRRVDVWCDDRNAAFRNGKVRRVLRYNEREEVKFKGGIP